MNASLERLERLGRMEWLINLPKQIACVAREIAFRERVYPRWIAAGKMRQDKADYEAAAMKAVLETLHAASAGPASAAALVAQYRGALEQCVRVAQAWHGDEAFDIYFNHAPEMKPIRDLLGKMPEPDLGGD